MGCIIQRRRAFSTAEQWAACSRAEIYNRIARPHFWEFEFEVQEREEGITVGSGAAISESWRKGGDGSSVRGDNLWESGLKRGFFVIGEMKFLRMFVEVIGRLRDLSL